MMQSRISAFAHSVSGAVPGHAWAEPIERHDPPAAARRPDEVSRRAWFVFRGQRRCVNWLGPRGGEELLQALGDAFHIARRTRAHPSGKLIYLLDPRTREIVDIDSELSEEAVLEVQVLPKPKPPTRVSMRREIESNFTVKETSRRCVAIFPPAALCTKIQHRSINR